MISIEHFFLGRNKFKTQKEIIDIINEYIESNDESKDIIDTDTTNIEFLLIFQTSTQRTWLVVNFKGLYCILDDINKHLTNVKWFINKSELNNINVSVNNKSKYKNCGLLTIGKYKNWLFSKKLFTDESKIEKEVKHLISQPIMSNQNQNNMKNDTYNDSSSISLIDKSEIVREVKNLIYKDIKNNQNQNNMNSNSDYSPSSGLTSDDQKTEMFLYKLVHDNFASRGDIQQLILVIYRRYVWHLRNFRNAEKKYNNLDKKFSIFIPVYSTLLTFLLSTNIIDSFLNNSEIEKNILAISSLILSIATVLNSTLRPREKEVELSNLLIKLNSWIVDFIEGLIEKKDNNAGDKEMNLFLKSMDDQITKLGERALMSLNSKEATNAKDKSKL